MRATVTAPVDRGLQAKAIHTENVLDPKYKILKYNWNLDEVKDDITICRTESMEREPVF